MGDKGKKDKAKKEKKKKALLSIKEKRKARTEGAVGVAAVRSKNP